MTPKPMNDNNLGGSTPLPQPRNIPLYEMDMFRKVWRELADAAMVDSYGGAAFIRCRAMYVRDTAPDPLTPVSLAARIVRYNDAPDHSLAATLTR